MEKVKNKLIAKKYYRFYKLWHKKVKCLKDILFLYFQWKKYQFSLKIEVRTLIKK